MASSPHDKAAKKLTDIVAVLRPLYLRLGEALDNADAILAGAQTIGQHGEAIVKWYKSVWEREYRDLFVWGKADVAIVTQLLKAGMPVEEVRRRLAAYLAAREQFYVMSKHSIPVFRVSVNRFARGGEALTLVSPPRDCRHTPTCVDDDQCTRRRRA